MIPELEAIKRTLRVDWDPIGVSDISPDEYDSYAFRIFVMLSEGKGENDISDYLYWVATEHMGLDGTDDHICVARKIVRLDAGGE